MCLPPIFTHTQLTRDSRPCVYMCLPPIYCIFTRTRTANYRDSRPSVYMCLPPYIFTCTQLTRDSRQCVYMCLPPIFTRTQLTSYRDNRSCVYMCLPPIFTRTQLTNPIAISYWSVHVYVCGGRSQRRAHIINTYLHACIIML